MLSNLEIINHVFETIKISIAMSRDYTVDRLSEQNFSPDLLFFDLKRYAFNPKNVFRQLEFASAHIQTITLKGAPNSHSTK